MTMERLTDEELARMVEEQNAVIIANIVCRENYDAIYSQDHPRTDAGGWLQWKGTDACVDLWCVCGHGEHLDASFMYYVQCSQCGRTYAVGQNIKLIELTEEQAREAHETPSVHSF